MTNRDIESRIDRLPQERQEVFKERIAPIKEKLENQLKERHRGDIENQIKSDESELSDFNVVVSCFLGHDTTSYRFIRTEPLIHLKEKNFDVLIAAPEKNIVVLVEIERTLLNRLPSKLSRFEGKMDVVQSDGEDVDVDSYLEQIINTTPEAFDFVLSSQFLDSSDLENEAQNRGLNFVAWLLASQGNECRVQNFTIKERKEAPFDGHTDGELDRYIDTVLASAVEKVDYLSFTHSSSKYVKLRDMAIPLVNRYQREAEDPTWDYEDWRRLFGSEVDLQNYLEDEKRTIFENFVGYGMDCGAVGKEEDLGGKFTNRYKIKTQATKSQEILVDELMQKMAEHRMQGDFKAALNEEKNRIVTELERDHATGGYTLDDFPK